MDFMMFEQRHAGERLSVDGLDFYGAWLPIPHNSYLVNVENLGTSVGKYPFLVVEPRRIECRQHGNRKCQEAGETGINYGADNWTCSRRRFNLEIDPRFEVSVDLSSDQGWPPTRRPKR